MTTLPSVSSWCSTTTSGVSTRQRKVRKSRRVDLSRELRRTLVELREKRLLEAYLEGKNDISDELVLRERANGAQLHSGHSRHLRPPDSGRQRLLRIGLTESRQRKRKQVRNNPHVPRNKAKWRFRWISCKSLRILVAAGGLEPPTYGL